MKRLFCLALILALPACGASPARNAQQPGAQVDIPPQSLTLSIISGKATHRFTVEIARTAQEQEKGLMFRKELAPDAGMLFPFTPPRVASFWMKNTVIPLDMIFIRPDGTIAMIAENTEPYSLQPVSAGQVVKAVLEIPGGRAKALGIKAEDRVQW